MKILTKRTISLFLGNAFGVILASMIASFLSLITVAFLRGRYDSVPFFPKPFLPEGFGALLILVPSVGQMYAIPALFLYTLITTQLIVSGRGTATIFVIAATTIYFLNGLGLVFLLGQHNSQWHWPHIDWFIVAVFFVTGLITGFLHWRFVKSQDDNRKNLAAMMEKNHA